MNFNRIITLGLLCSIVSMGAMNQTEAVERVTSLGGNGYAESIQAPRMGYALVFGAVALGGIIAFAFMKSEGGTGHSHQ